MKVGLRSINKEGREQGKKFGVEQYEMRTFSRDREHLENLVRPSHALCRTFSFYFCMLISKVKLQNPTKISASCFQNPPDNIFLICDFFL